MLKSFNSVNTEPKLHLIAHLKELKLHNCFSFSAVSHFITGGVCSTSTSHSVSCFHMLKRRHHARHRTPPYYFVLPQQMSSFSDEDSAHKEPTVLSSGSRVA